MKKLILRSIVLLMSVAALSVASAGNPLQQARLEGAWDTQVTSTDCNGNILAACVKLERQIHLSANGNRFTATTTFAVYDPDGNLIFSGCGDEVATCLP